MTLITNKKYYYVFILIDCLFVLSFQFSLLVVAKKYAWKDFHIILAYFRQGVIANTLEMFYHHLDTGFPFFIFGEVVVGSGGVSNFTSSVTEIDMNGFSCNFTMSGYNERNNLERNNREHLGWGLEMCVWGEGVHYSFSCLDILFHATQTGCGGMFYHHLDTGFPFFIFGEVVVGVEGVSNFTSSVTEIDMNGFSCNFTVSGYNERNNLERNNREHLVWGLEMCVWGEGVHYSFSCLDILFHATQTGCGGSFHSRSACCSYLFLSLSWSWKFADLAYNDPCSVLYQI